MILHIFMYNVISDFSAVTPASEGRVKAYGTQVLSLMDCELPACALGGVTQLPVRGWPPCSDSYISVQKLKLLFFRNT